MTKQLVGKWKLVESINFDEFLRELGVSAIWRKIAETATPTVTIQHESSTNTWSILTETMLKSSCFKCVIGQEFEETRADGAKVKSVLREDGDRLVQTQYGGAGGKDTEIIREINGEGKLKVTCKCSSVEAIRRYNRI